MKKTRRIRVVNVKILPEIEKLVDNVLCISNDDYYQLLISKRISRNDSEIEYH